MAKDEIQVMELSKSGERRRMTVKQDKLINSLSDYKLPFRDLRMLLKSTDTARHPYILPRPSSHCFLFAMEHIKLVCFSDKCLILNPDEKATENFINGLKMQFPCKENASMQEETIDINTESSMRQLIHKIVENLDFEHVILENALENIVGKFGRHLQIIKPVLERLLEPIEKNPETNGLKRLLAVKKSLAKFEQSVELVIKVIRNLLGDDADMLRLYLTHPDRQDEKKIGGGRAACWVLFSGSRRDCQRDQNYD